MPRLFVAIDLPETHGARLQGLADPHLDARWTPQGQHHLTLRFIGEVSAETVEAIKAGLADVTGEALTLEGHGLDVFPSRRRPRVLFSRIAPTPALERVQIAVESALRGLGLTPNTKPFTPHVTLARFKRPRPRDVRAYLRAHHGFALPPFPAKEFLLYQSILRPDGAQHQVLAWYPLQRDV